MNEQKNINYKVSAETARFLDALDKFQEFRNAFWNALVWAYSEEQAAELLKEHAEQFDAVERSILEQMRPFLTVDMGRGDTDVTI